MSLHRGEQSPTYLDVCLSELTRNGFLHRVGARYGLVPHFERFRHVTFYELGAYDKRLAGS